MTRRLPRHFPDRRAHQHRQRARRWFVVAAVAVFVLPWFGYRAVRSAIDGWRVDAAEAVAAPSARARPGTAAPLRGVPPEPASAASARSAAGVPVRPSPGRAPMAAPRGQGSEPPPPGVDVAPGAAPVALPPLSGRGMARVREAARQALLRDPRIGDAGWVDRRELDLVAAAAPLSAADGEALCARLATFGGVEDVVLRRVGAAAGALHRCAMDAAAATGQGSAPAVVTSPGTADLATLRARVEADTAAAEADAARAARNAESMRILEERVPEL